MKTYRATDNTGNTITFRAATAQEAYEKAQALKHAPVRIEEIKATRTTKKGKAK
jgi:hypothetical protein